jgi:hypothetical protein
LAGFDPGELSAALEDRRVVRLALMRSTLHLVRAGDAVDLRRLVQPGLDRALRGVIGPRLADLDQVAVAAATRQLLGDEARSLDALGVELARRWPDFDPADLARVARTVVPLVQVPPRGIWGASGPAHHRPLDDWLASGARPGLDRGGLTDLTDLTSPTDRTDRAGPTDLTDRAGPADLVRRYLDAFGPASVADVQTWTGLTRLAGVVEGLRSELVTFRDERGVELFDRPDALRPPADQDVPATLVGPFDNLVLAHADRSRVLGDLHHRRVMTVNGLVHGLVLVDGFVQGRWRVRRTPAPVTIEVVAFARLGRSTSRAVVERAEAAASFLATATGAAGAVEVSVEVELGDAGP